MEIVDIQTFVVGNPWKNWVFCRLYTDEGITGLGEATGGLHTKPVDAVFGEIKELCIGEDPLSIPMLYEKLLKSLYLPEDGIVSHALAGIEMACWDILGKKLGLPLYQLLGGRAHQQIRAYANGWYRGPRKPEFFAERAEEVTSMGYTALKFDPFGKNYKRMRTEEMNLSIDIVKAVREAVGEEVDILIEAHDRFSPSTAKEVASRLRPYNPMWIETPVISTDIKATIAVAQATDIPVATGERFKTTRQFVDLLESRAVDIVQPELLNTGGIIPLLEAFHVARALGSDVAPHNAQSPLCTAVNVHVGITQPNFLIQECFDDFQDPEIMELFHGVPQVKDGYLEPKDQPGIGVEIDEERIGEFPYNSQNFLRLFERGWEKRGRKED